MSHNTALEFWRSLERSPLVAALRANVADAAFPNLSAPTADELNAVAALLPSASTRHLLTPTAQARRRTKGVASHVAPSAIPTRAIIRVGQGLYVVSPEWCFLQMALLLSLPQLIALGCELCGTYRSPLQGPTRYSQPFLTSKEDLEAFLDECVGLPGVKKARQALRYLSANSASPMETTLIMMLCLPMDMGGYALPYPQQNVRIDFPKRLRKMCSKSYYVCDLYWPDARLAIEYDSDLSHTSSESLTVDASKRNELSYLDITVVTVTLMHVLSWAHMDRIAKLICKRLKLRKRPQGDFRRRQSELRKELLDFQKRP